MSFSLPNWQAVDAVAMHEIWERCLNVYIWNEKWNYLTWITGVQYCSHSWECGKRGDAQQLTESRQQMSIYLQWSQGRLFEKRIKRFPSVLCPFFFFFFWQLHWHCSWYCVETACVLYFMVSFTLSHQTYSWVMKEDFSVGTVLK